MTVFGLPALEYTVIAFIIASPTLALFVVWAVRDRRRRARSEPVPLFWSEMKPGKRYRVEMTVQGHRVVDFVDEFVCYTHAFTRARFVSRTIERNSSDQVRVTSA